MRSSRSEVAPFHVMRVLAAAARRRAEGLPVHDLSAGQPSTPAPKPVLAAAHAALDADRLAYTPALGIPELRAAIAEHCRRWYGIDVGPEAIAVTTGSSGAFVLAFLAAFDPGDSVAILRPGYPAYRNLLGSLGCRVIDVPVGPQTRFQTTIDQLDALDEPPAGLIVASPANPTGSMVSPDDLRELSAWCDRSGVRFISDEIYHGISFGEPGACAWQFGRNSIVANSFSKYFSMTGWRLGWLLLPEELRDPVDRLAGNLALCPPALSQRAALAAFEAYDELDANVARYRRTRELLLDRLPAIGLDRLAPVDGAFYVYADVSGWTEDSLSFCARLLAETGVAVAPGVDFDRVDGGRFLRMCFAGDTDEVAEAVDVLGEWLSRQ